MNKLMIIGGGILFIAVIPSMMVILLDVLSFGYISPTDSFFNLMEDYLPIMLGISMWAIILLVIGLYIDLKNDEVAMLEKLRRKK